MLYLAITTIICYVCIDNEKEKDHISDEFPLI